MSVLHRIDEIEAMPAPRFFAYCQRLPAYQGVLAAVARRQQSERQQRAQAPAVSLAEWARTHPAEMQDAHQQMTEGR